MYKSKLIKKVDEMDIPKFIKMFFGRFPGRDVPDSMEVIVEKYKDTTYTGGPYSVGGTVDPTYGSITLINNGDDDLDILEDGSFTFDTKLNDGASYIIEVKDRSDTSQGQLCAVSGGSNGDGSGTINGANVININVSCVTI